MLAQNLQNSRPRQGWLPLHGRHHSEYQRITQTGTTSGVGRARRLDLAIGRFRTADVIGVAPMELSTGLVNQTSPSEAKIALFRSLFRALTAGIILDDGGVLRVACQGVLHQRQVPNAERSNRR